MIKTVIFAAVATVALAQLHLGDWSGFNGFQGTVIDTLHGFQVEYDDRHDLVMMVNRTDCFVVTAADDNTWDSIVKNEDELHKTSEALYAQIKAGTGISALSQRDEFQFHSLVERFQCNSRDSWKVDFTPN